MDDVLDDIVNALESWTDRIVDAEAQIKNLHGIQKLVEDSLKRQVLDGLITEQDSAELAYTCDLWVKLYKSQLCKSSGADFSDREVLGYLLELYTLKQISKRFFVDIALELCRQDQ